MEQKIKQNGIDIGGNIRRIRLEKGYGQTELVRMLQLKNIDITRETGFFRVFSIFNPSPVSTYAIS